MTSNNMDYITIALPKGKLFGLSADLLAKVGYTAEDLSEKSRKLVITNEEKKIKFIISKTADVPTYVEYGAAASSARTSFWSPAWMCMSFWIWALAGAI